MNKLHALTALSLGILASSSGVLQVQAAQYNFFVDFSTKEVANYSAYRQTFNEDTDNLNLEVNFNFSGTYRFDSCPTVFTQNVRYIVFARINGTGAFTTVVVEELPDFLCNTSFSFYDATMTSTLPSSFLDQVVDDDTNFIQFATQILFIGSASSNGRTLFLEDYTVWFDLTYDFGTTYLFNYFLSDQAYGGRTPTGSWTFNLPQTSYLSYVYTTAGNDQYYIRNTNQSNIGLVRKKYAIDYNNEFFRGQSVGAGFFTDHFGPNPDQVVLSLTTSLIRYDYNYFYLNVSNVAQPIVNVPQFNFTYQNCSGGFLDINVGCFVNNALAYLTNDAPIISDATQLVNAGIGFVGQTFGVIGSFSTNNMFGYLVLGGFGFIVIKSLFKNDK
jgi:hypothetical protein